MSKPGPVPGFFVSDVCLVGGGAVAELNRERIALPPTDKTVFDLLAPYREFFGPFHGRDA